LRPGKPIRSVIMLPEHWARGLGKGDLILRRWRRRCGGPCGFGLRSPGGGRVGGWERHVLRLVDRWSGDFHILLDQFRRAWFFRSIAPGERTKERRVGDRPTRGARNHPRQKVAHAAAPSAAMAQ
jgi:hypothetical protein